MFLFNQTFNHLSEWYYLKLSDFPSQIPNLPIVVPISPTAENELVQSGVAALDIGALESPSTPNETKEEAVEATADASRSSGLFGWMKEALPGKKILAKVAEKARSSVDTMITTLDPQMKEFICKTQFFFFIITTRNHHLMFIFQIQEATLILQ